MYLRMFKRRSENGNLAPIGAVMQFCSTGYEALQLHLSGKRDHKYQRGTTVSLLKKIYI